MSDIYVGKNRRQWELVFAGILNSESKDTPKYQRAQKIYNWLVVKQKEKEKAQIVIAKIEAEIKEPKKEKQTNPFRYAKDSLIYQRPSKVLN